MPDSLSSDDLKNLRAIYPNPPYQEHLYQYSYFMGDQGRSNGNGSGKTDWPVVQGSTYPKLTLRRHENVSSKQPYAMYEDVELKPGPEPGDDWPYQMYYYLMDVDTKGPVAVRPGQVVYLPASRVKGARGSVATRQSKYIKAQAPMELPQPQVKKLKPTETFLALEGWW
jgi:hypothetical protein